MLRAPSPEIVPPSNVAFSVRRGGTAGGDRAGLGGPATIRGATGVLGGGSFEPAVERDVDLGALDQEPLAAPAAGAAGLDREREPHAVDLLVAAEVGLGDVLGAADLAHRGDPDLEVGVGIEEHVLDVAVAAGHAQLDRRRAVGVFVAEVLDLVALVAPADQRAVDVGQLRERVGLVVGRLLGLAAAAEWIDRPAVVAVVAGDLGQALDRGLAAHLAGPPEDLGPRRLDHAAPAAEHHASGEPQRLDLAQLGFTAAGGEVLRQDLLERRRTTGMCERHDHHDRDRNQVPHARSMRPRPRRGNTPPARHG
jgi:hypothetical protein